MAEVLTPEAYALLEAISGTESKRAWDVIYDGQKFSDFSAHPRVFVTINSGPNKGKKSSAAGKFQITATTYDRVAPKLGITDFSPKSQEQIAWYLAKDAYGPNLQTALASGNRATLAKVARKLSSVWTSLPSGIEQGTTTGKFYSAYTKTVSALTPAPQPRPRLDRAKNNTLGALALLPRDMAFSGSPQDELVSLLEHRADSPKARIAAAREETRSQQRAVQRTALRDIAGSPMADTGSVADEVSPRLAVGASGEEEAFLPSAVPDPGSDFVRFDANNGKNRMNQQGLGALLGKSFPLTVRNPEMPIEVDASGGGTAAAGIVATGQGQATVIGRTGSASAAAGGKSAASGAASVAGAAPVEFDATPFVLGMLASIRDKGERELERWKPFMAEIGISDKELNRVMKRTAELGLSQEQAMQMTEKQQKKTGIFLELKDPKAAMRAIGVTEFEWYGAPIIPKDDWRWPAVYGPGGLIDEKTTAGQKAALYLGLLRGSGNFPELRASTLTPARFVGDTPLPRTDPRTGRVLTAAGVGSAASGATVRAGGRVSAVTRETPSRVTGEGLNVYTRKLVTIDPRTGSPILVDAPSEAPRAAITARPSASARVAAAKSVAARAAIERERIFATPEQVEAGSGFRRAPDKTQPAGSIVPGKSQIRLMTPQLVVDPDAPRRLDRAAPNMRTGSLSDENAGFPPIIPSAAEVRQKITVTPRLKPVYVTPPLKVAATVTSEPRIQLGTGGSRRGRPTKAPKVTTQTVAPQQPPANLRGTDRAPKLAVTKPAAYDKLRPQVVTPRTILPAKPPTPTFISATGQSLTPTQVRSYNADSNIFETKVIYRAPSTAGATLSEPRTEGTDIFGRDNAFLPRSVQESVRFQTGY